MDIQMEHVLLGLIDYASDGVIAIRDGLVVYANESANKLAEKDLNGKKAFEVFRAAMLPEIKKCKRDTVIECYLFDKPVRMRVQKKEDLLIFIIQRDEMEEQRSVGQEVILETSNEIRSALAVLMTVLETTLQDNPYWGIAYRNCCRILRSLTSSRFLLISQEDFEREMESADLVMRMKKNHEELSQLLKALSIEVTFETDLQQLDAVYHLQAIRRVFLTLVADAIRRIGYGGKIHLSLNVTENGQNAMISIWDQKGKGQPLQDIAISQADRTVANRIMRLSKGLILRETPKPDELIATMIFPICGADYDYLNLPSLEMKAISQILVELSGVLPSSCYQK